MSPTLRAMMLAAAAGMAKADWYHGAPECAQSCLSSAYSDPTITSGAAWPAATAYCADDGPDAGSCISDACEDGDDKSAVSSYSAMSASICQGYSSCVDAGNTGVQTFSYGGGPVTWAAPGGWAANVNPTGASQTVVDAYNSAVGNSTGSAAEDAAAATATASGAPLGFGGAKGPGDNNREQWSEWASVYSGSATWSGGAVTATGCAGFGGSPWYVGPGCGWNDKGGFDGWMGWGEGWEWIESSTVETVTYTTTDAEGSAETTVGPQTLAVAVSDGTYTLTSTLAQAQETGSDSDGSDGDSGSDDQEGAASGRLVPAAGGDGNIVTGLMGLALGGMVVMVGLL